MTSKQYECLVISDATIPDPYLCIRIKLNIPKILRSFTEICYDRNPEYRISKIFIASTQHEISHMRKFPPSENINMTQKSHRSRWRLSGMAFAIAVV